MKRSLLRDLRAALRPLSYAPGRLRTEAVIVLPRSITAGVRRWSPPGAVEVSTAAVWAQRLKEGRLLATVLTFSRDCEGTALVSGEASATDVISRCGGLPDKPHRLRGFAKEGT